VGPALKLHHLSTGYLVGITTWRRNSLSLLDIPVYGPCMLRWAFGALTVAAPGRYHLLVAPPAQAGAWSAVRAAGRRRRSGWRNHR